MPAFLRVASEKTVGDFISCSMEGPRSCSMEGTGRCLLEAGADLGRWGNLSWAALYAVKKVSVDGGGTGANHLRRLSLALSNSIASVSRIDGERLL